MSLSRPGDQFPRHLGVRLPELRRYSFDRLPDDQKLVENRRLGLRIFKELRFRRRSFELDCEARSF